MKFIITSFFVFVVSFSFAQTHTQDCKFDMPNTVKNVNGLYPVEIVSSCPIRKVEIKVMNRWGEVIYTTTNLKHDWQGRNTPDGVYYISVSGEYYGTGEQFNATGYLNFFN